MFSIFLTDFGKFFNLIIYFCMKPVNWFFNEKFKGIFFDMEIFWPICPDDVISLNPHSSSLNKSI
jgi:hypothetical protein